MTEQQKIQLADLMLDLDHKIKARNVAVQAAVKAVDDAHKPLIEAAQKALEAFKKANDQ